jgi:CBS domain containing-hemolysin-like protein
MLKRLKQDNVDRSLAAILTLNTIAHTVGAIGAGAKATAVFGSTWFGVFSAVMTLMILFLSEIVPKTIGAIYWASLTGPTAVYINLLIVVLYPIVWLSEKLTRLISRGKTMHIFSRDEFIAMASMGEQTGQIHSKESRIIQNLLRFERLKHIMKTPFSRLPLYRSHLDDATGFVLKDDILIFMAQKRGNETLKTLKRDILAVPSSIPLTVLFERFLAERQHIALIVSEHGGTDGLVTLEDLIETLMGMEIVDERDNVIDMRALARKQWMARARAMGLEPELTETTEK